MACDTFSSAHTKELLDNRFICFFGDSNIRALYKDLLWLLENGTLIPDSRLRSKNEVSHANDIRLSEGVLHSGRNYEEVRMYYENPYINFYFITRLFMPSFIDAIKNLDDIPDVIVLNSCLWDLTRWGTNGVSEFKENLVRTFDFLRKELPSTRIIWLTTLPPNFKAHGGFLTKEVEFVRNMLPWHIVFANKYASDIAKSFNIDVLDLHYNFRFLLNYHVKDGIHWNSSAVRHTVNILLTHLALVWNYALPGEFKLDRMFLERSQAFIKSDFNSKSKRIHNNKCKNNYRNNNAHINPELHNSHSFNSFGNSSNELNLYSNGNIGMTDTLYDNFESTNRFDGQSSNHLNNAIDNFRSAFKSLENCLHVAPRLNANQCTININHQNRGYPNNNRIAKNRKRKKTRLEDVFRNHFY